MQKYFSLVILFFLTLAVHAQVNELAGLKYFVNEGTYTKGNPTVILVHGYGSNESDLLNLANYLPKECRVIAVRAPITLGLSSYAWYNIDQNNGVIKYNSSEVLVARKQLAKFVQAVKHKFAANTIYLVGFSQGAIMSADVAFNYPNLVKAVALLSGKILPETTANLVPTKTLNELNVFIGHGKNDKVVPIFNGREAGAICMGLNIPAVYKEYTSEHEIVTTEITDLVAWIKSLYSDK